MNSGSDITKKTELLILKLVHLFITVALFAFAWFEFRYHGNILYAERGFRYNYYVIIFYAAAVFWFDRTYNAYLLGYNRIRTLVFAQFISQLFASFGTYLAVSVAWGRFDSPKEFVILLIPQLLLDIIWTYFATLVFFKLNKPLNTILIYRNALDKKRFGLVEGKPAQRLYHISKEICFDGKYSDIRDQLSGYDAVFVAGVNSRCRNGILKYCKENSIPGMFLPHVGDVILKEARHIQSFDSPVLYIDRSVLDPEYVIVKRLFDFVSSLLGLIILSPFILIIAIMIKAYDGGPVIYKQARLTKDEKVFDIYKFRSMTVDAESDGVARLSAGKNDSRITPVGSFLRKCRFDEIPQLVNILKGDMSVVGPRPERPEIAEQYYKVMPDFRLRLQVKAGLTGYAQVYGKYNIDPYEKLEFDLLYINSMSMLTDLRLIFATFAILFSPESTLGVDEDSVTALDLDDERFKE